MASLFDALRQPGITNRPPSAGEIRRNDILIVAWVIFALVLGYGIRNRALTTSRTIGLGENLPSIAVPRDWLTSRSDEYLFQATNPRSGSSFDAEIDVFARPLKSGETLELARVSWVIRRSREVDRYRELEVQPARVLGDQPALISTYAYIADPTRDSGAIGLPVVVQAQDLLFLAGDRLIAVTTAADATEWDETSSQFRNLFESLRVETNVEGEE